MSISKDKMMVKEDKYKTYQTTNSLLWHYVNLCTN